MCVRSSWCRAKGTKKLIDRMGDVFGSHVKEPPFEVRIDEVDDGDERVLDDVARLNVCRTRHTDNSVAYRIETDSRSMCFTGDTGMSDRSTLPAQVRRGGWPARVEIRGRRPAGDLTAGPLRWSDTIGDFQE